MQVYDKVNKTELTADTEELIKLMAPGGRQVDLYLKEKKIRRGRIHDMGRRALVQRRRKTFHPLLLSGGPRIKRIHRPQHLRPEE